MASHRGHFFFFFYLPTSTCTGFLFLLTFSLRTFSPTNLTCHWLYAEKKFCTVFVEAFARLKDARTFIATVKIGAIWPCITTPPPMSARHGVFSLKIHTSHVVPAPDSFTNYSPTLNTNKLFCLMHALRTATVDITVGRFFFVLFFYNCVMKVFEMGHESWFTWMIRVAFPKSLAYCLFVVWRNAVQS